MTTATRRTLLSTGAGLAALVLVQRFAAKPAAAQSSSEDRGDKERHGRHDHHEDHHHKHGGRHS